MRRSTKACSFKRPDRKNGRAQVGTSGPPAQPQDHASGPNLDNGGPDAGADHRCRIDPRQTRDRPAEIEDRAIPGHWEGDPLSGARNSHIATLVERRLRFVVRVKVGGKHSDSVVSTLIARVQHLPQGGDGLADLRPGNRTGLSSQAHRRDGCQRLPL